MLSTSHAAGSLRGSAGRRPITAPALRPPQSPVRLLAVVLLTVAVVTVWGRRDEPAPVAAEPQVISVVRADPAPAPEARISLPAAAAATPAPAEFSAGPAPAIVLPRLRADALPRPPEPADPVQPAAFIHFIAQPGDTLYDVSVVYGVSIDDLLRFNPGLGDGTQILVGQIIFVPEE